MAQTIQILRTNSNTPPAALLPGVLSAELGPQTKLWIGATGGNRLLLSSDPVDNGAAAGAYLKLTGGTLTGPLQLAADPAVNLGAATKQYVDAVATAGAAADTAIRNTYLPLAGGTLTGTLVLNGDPVAALAAATKNYVDINPARAVVATTPPASHQGGLWFDNNDGHFYCFYDDGTSQQWVSLSGPAGPAGPGSPNNVGRNLAHNPLFNIAQRGAGPFAASGAYTLDRWVMLLSVDVSGVNQVKASDTDRAALGDEAATNLLQCGVSGNAGAGSFTLLQQRIEDVRRLAGKTVTVSFWANAAAAIKIGVSIDQYFGSGGSPSAIVSGNGQAVSIPGLAWARYSLTFTVPSVLGKTLGTNGDSNTQLFLWYSAGTTYATRSGSIGVQTGTVNVWGIQLEIGSVATPLEKPDPQQDLAKCQRFYQAHLQVLTWGYNVAAASTYNNYWMPVTMRAAPSVTYANTSFANASVITSAGSHPSNILTQITIVATASGWGMADVLLSAEL